MGKRFPTSSTTSYFGAWLAVGAQGLSSPVQVAKDTINLVYMRMLLI